MGILYRTLWLLTCMWALFNDRGKVVDCRMSLRYLEVIISKF